MHWQYTSSLDKNLDLHFITIKVNQIATMNFKVWKPLIQILQDMDGPNESI